MSLSAIIPLGERDKSLQYYSKPHPLNPGAAWGLLSDSLNLALRTEVGQQQELVVWGWGGGGISVDPTDLTFVQRPQI